MKDAENMFFVVVSIGNCAVAIDPVLFFDPVVL